jgi:hypothetical protein
MGWLVYIPPLEVLKPRQTPGPLAQRRYLILHGPAAGPAPPWATLFSNDFLYISTAGPAYYQIRKKEEEY